MASIVRAIRRAKWSILTIAAVYVISIFAGIVMVQAGNGFALNSRDKIVNQANQQESAEVKKFASILYPECLQPVEFIDYRQVVSNAK
jgi:hypothetical protein